MKCPKCKKEINYVVIYCAISGVGQLKKNKIVERMWKDPYFNTKITDIDCPECNEDISDVIKE